MSEVLDSRDPEARRRVADALTAGDLAVVPTESVYALVADAFRVTATRRLLRVRGAGRSRPLTVLVRSQRQVVGLAGDLSEAADRLIAAYWPGPLTIVLRAAPGLTWDLGNTAGTVALRSPTDDDLVAVIGEVGPLASSGACVRGRSPATTVSGAREQLGEAVACYLDGGTRDREVSTVVDATRDEAVEVLRPGAVGSDDIQRVASGALEWGARPRPDPDPGPVPGSGGTVAEDERA